MLAYTPFLTVPKMLVSNFLCCKVFGRQMTRHNLLTSWIRFQLQYDILSPVLLISYSEEFIYFVISKGNRRWFFMLFTHLIL